MLSKIYRDKINKYTSVFILFLIISIALILRIYGLTDISLSGDELFTLNIISKNFDSLKDIVYIGNIQDTHPPLYHIALYLFIKIFKLQVCEYSIRLFSVIIGVLSVFFLFLLGKRLFSIREGIISSAIMSLIWTNILVSQLARGYSLVLLLSILTLYFLSNIICSFPKCKVKDFVFYILFSILSIYTHYFCLLLIFCELLFLLVFFRKKLIKSVLITTLVIFVSYIPWIKFINPRYIFTVYPNFINWLETDCFGGYKKYLMIFFILTVIFFIICFYIKNKDLKKTINKYKKEILLLFISTIPFFITYITHVFLFNCYNNRYLIISVPTVYLLTARGITLIFKNFILLTIFCIVLFFSIFCFSTNNFYEHRNGKYYEQTYEVMHGAKVCFNLNPNNTILIFEFENYFDYYIDKMFKEYKNQTFIIDYYKEDKNIASIIHNIIQTNNPNYIILIDSLKKEHLNYLSKNFANILIEECRSWDLYVFKTNHS